MWKNFIIIDNIILTKTQKINFIFTIKDIAKNLFIGNVHIFH